MGGGEEANGDNDAADTSDFDAARRTTTATCTTTFMIFDKKKQPQHKKEGDYQTRQSKTLVMVIQSVVWRKSERWALRREAAAKSLYLYCLTQSLKKKTNGIRYRSVLFVLETSQASEPKSKKLA